MNLTVRSGLVLVEDDLREPFAVEDAVDVLRLDLVGHEVIAVGVAADVFVEQVGKLPGERFWGSPLYQSATKSIPSGFVTRPAG